MPKNPYSEVDIAPLTGPMDARSSPDQVPFGGWRLVQNMEVRQQRKLFRASQWRKLLDDTNNGDLHDQLLSLAASGSIREPIVYLQEFTSRSGFSKLIAGTVHRLYELNNATGNWRIISDQLGASVSGACSEFGWVADQVDDTVIFSNGVDDPVYYVIEQPANAGTDQSVSMIPDLAAIGVSSAKVVTSLKGIMILANVVQEGLRAPMRIITADINRPLSWTPNQDLSTAIQVDISSSGEGILAAVPIADSLFMYTNLGIWEVSLSGDLGTVLSVRRRFNGTSSGNRCLAYRRAIISTGSTHIYMGRDGIYQYDLHAIEPERVEWMHRASSLIYDDLSVASCHTPCAGYDSNKKTAYFSWPTPGNICNTKTLALNTEYSFSSLIDHGFNALAFYHPDTPLTIREWLTENCICSEESLDEIGFGFIKEGKYCVTPPPPDCDPEDYPTNIYSNTNITIDGALVEDFTQSEPSPGSLCAKLATLNLEELCDRELTSDECQADQIFIGASGTDFSVKEFHPDVYYRERLIRTVACPSGEGLQGVYSLDGFKNILRSGALDFKDPQNAKNIARLVLEAFAEDAESPSKVDLRVGAAYQAADPNIDRCPIVWHVQPFRLLKCVSAFDGAAHLKANTRPAMNVEWATFVENNFIYFEFSTDGTGGASFYSRVGLQVRKKNRY